MDYQISYKEGDFNPMMIADIPAGTGDGYRYAFNGMERDDQLKGVGNSYDFGARIYDPRIGRWLTPDPQEYRFSQLSTYVAFENAPISVVDLDGKSGVAEWKVDKEKTKTLIIKANFNYIEGTVDQKVLDAVKAEWNKTYSKIKYTGEDKKINVEFNISFSAHPEGTDLKKFDGSNGQNSLRPEDLSSREYEASNREGIAFDPTNAKEDVYQASNPSGDDPNAVISATAGDATDPANTITKAISHGVGHNLGLLHSDKGVMNDLDFKFRLKIRMPNQQNQKDEYYLQFSAGTLNHYNVQQLINRIPEMTEKKNSYWDGKTDSHFSDAEQKVITEDVSSTGVVIKK